MASVVSLLLASTVLVVTILQGTDATVDDLLSPPPNVTHTRNQRRGERVPRFIRFKTDSREKMMINLEFSVPFLTVPLRQEDPTQPPAPVEVNVRGILMAAGLGAVASLVVPVLTGSPGPFSAFLPVPADVPNNLPPTPPWN